MTRMAILALDQGGHASRACVVDEEGRLLAEHQVPIETLHHDRGHIEHDPDAIVRSLHSAASGALQTLPDVQLRAAGLATQRSTIVCFDRTSGAPLSAAISWQDRRNATLIDALAPHAEHISALTGLPLSAHYGASKMRWCLDHLPAVRAAAVAGTLRLSPLAPFLVQALTGADSGVDPANASRTLLWEMATRDWSAELLRLFGIERSWLPTCTWTRAAYGTLALPDRDPVPLTTVTGDQSAIPFAFGEPDPHALYINLGTGAFLQRPLTTRPLRAAPLLASVLAADPDATWYCLEGTVNGAGSAVSAFAREEGVEETVLWSAIEVTTEDPPLYINGVGGLGSPYWRPAQRSYFIGEGTRSQRFAAVLESIVFLIALNAASMRAAGPIDRVLLTGGLSRSDWLCQRLASLMEVDVTRATREATVMGLASLTSGCTFSRLDAPTTVFAPDALPAAQREKLRGRLRRFEQALDAESA